MSIKISAAVPAGLNAMSSISDFLRCAKEMALNMMRALEGPAMAAPSEPMMVPSVVIVPSSLSLSN